MKYILTIFQLLLAVHFFAQTSWSENFVLGSHAVNNAFYFSRTNELWLGGNFLVPGVVNQRLFFLKVNPANGDSIDFATCIARETCDERVSIHNLVGSPDGNLITTGFLDFDPCNYLASVDSNLNIKWIKYLCSEDQIHFFTSILDQPDGILLTGSFSNLGVPIQKRAFNGDLIWHKYITTEDLDIRSPKLVQLEDGDFMLFYVSNTTGKVPKGHISKFDKQGNLAWTKEAYWLTHDLAKAVDGHILTVESESIFSSSNRVKKLDAQTGALIWQKDISFQDYFPPQAMSVDRLGNIYLAGTYRKIIDPITNKYMFCLAKLDPAGNVKWNKYYENDESENVRRMLIGEDNCIYLQGNREPTGKIEIVVKKITSDGILVSSIEPREEKTGVTLSPVPTADWLKIEVNTIEQAQLSYQIFSPIGQEVVSSTFNGTSTQVNLSSLSRGIYYLHLYNLRKSLGIYKFVKL